MHENKHSIRYTKQKNQSLRELLAAHVHLLPEVVAFRVTSMAHVSQSRQLESFEDCVFS
jgi:hypothetical protein